MKVARNDVRKFFKAFDELVAPYNKLSSAISVLDSQLISAYWDGKTYAEFLHTFLIVPRNHNSL